MPTPTRRHTGRPHHDPPARTARPISARLIWAAGALLAAGATATATAPALGEARVPFAPVDRLIERPADWAPAPVGKPTVRESFERTKSFAGRTCLTADPDATFEALPRPLRTLSHRQMLGQLLVISFSGKAPGDAGVEAAARALERSDIGGVLYFRHNVGSREDVRAVNRRFQDANPLIPAMISVDQEGGAVMRLKASEGAPDTPSALDIAGGSLADALRAYEGMAGALAELGFTANFGPVVDLLVNEKNPVIARFDRSYGEDPKTVSRYAKTFIRAHHDAGVATAIKHFPGHGSSTADSHEGAIDLNPTWSRTELLPFRDLIDGRAGSMVMVGHLMREGLSGPNGLPASLSPVAITQVLRDTLCFDGIVVSDDLAMQAISRAWDATEAVALMIEAGGDIALLSLAGNPQTAVRAILDALSERARADEAFARKIRHAYARVVTQKLRMEEAGRRARDKAVVRPAPAVALR